MRRDEVRSFLRLATAVALAGAALTLLDGLLTGLGPVADVLGDLLVELVELGFIAVAWALAWGVPATRYTRLARAAALGLVVSLVVPPIVASLGAIDPPWPHAWLALHFASATAFVLGLGPRGARERAASALGLLGLGAARLAPLADLAPLQLVGLLVWWLALAFLFARQGTRAVPAPPRASLDAWRETGQGARLVILAERGRLWIVALAFAVGMVAGLASVRAPVMVIAGFGRALALAVATLGVLRMRVAPLGRVWIESALALGLLGLAVTAVDLASLAWPDLALGADLSAGRFFVIRIAAQHGVPAGALLGLAALAARVRPDLGLRGRRVAWQYAALAVLMLTQGLLTELDGPPLVAALLGLGLLAWLVVTISQFAVVADELRDALTAGAAEDAFGDEPEAAPPPKLSAGR